MQQQSPQTIIQPMSPSTVNTTMASVEADDLYQDELSASDIEESFVEHLEYEEKSEHDDVDDDNGLLLKSMTMTLRGPPSNYSSMNLKTKSIANSSYLEQLNSTPRMYGAGLHKALDRLAKKRPSDIDFIETMFKGNEIVLQLKNKNQYQKTYQLLDVLGQSMLSGAFLNKRLYLHKAVWEQNKVNVINYEKKLEVFGLMLSALNGLFTDDISIDWLKSDFSSHTKPFHRKLTKCEQKLRDAQTILTEFINKSQQKQREKGAARFLNKFKDKSRGKVFDNQPYRDLIYKICGHASAMQLFYIYLATQAQQSERKLLLDDIKGITLCMASFARVVIDDTKEFLLAYLRRGAKNIYQ